MLKIEEKVAAWLEQRKLNKLIRNFGGIQKCPWCRQWAQSTPDWRFETYEAEPYYDVLTCGNCQGTSLWRFEMWMMYMKPLSPPVPADPPS